MRAWPKAVCVAWVVVLAWLLDLACAQHEKALENAMAQAVVDVEKAKGTVRQVLEVDKKSFDAWNMLGVLELMSRNYKDAVTCFEKAVQIDPGRSDLRAHLGEALRLDGDISRAIHELEYGFELEKNSEERRNLYNLGVALVSAGEVDRAMQVYEQVLAVVPGHERAAENLAGLYEEQGKLEQAQQIFKTLRQDPSISMEARCRHLFQEASLKHRAGQISSAEALYQELVGMGHVCNAETIANTQINLGACLQARGQFASALQLFESSLQVLPGSPGALNNAGACLWHLGFQERALKMYQRALQISPDCREALINLGTAKYEVGELDAAKQLFSKAAEHEPVILEAAVRARIATMVHPIMDSCRSKGECARLLDAQFDRSLDELESWLVSSPLRSISDPITQVERLPFYWMYGGYNEYARQARMAAFYQHTVRDVARTVPDQQSTTKAAKHGQYRVGFLSKFWHDNHPHAQLLQGVLRGLRTTPFSSEGFIHDPLVSSRNFSVHVLALHNPRGGPCAEIVDAVGGVANVLPLSRSGSLSQMKLAIKSLGLDLLVFVDTMSEPVSHFLAHARLAPVQAAFWGNPVTMGSPMIDFFISGDWMETHCAAISDCPHPGVHPHYHEQLVRLTGSGIHYYRFPIPSFVQDMRANALAESLGQEPVQPPPAVVFSVLQSTFKLHPAFDLVLARILDRVPSAHVHFLEPRQHQWAVRLHQRLRNVLGDQVFEQRVHFFPRVRSSEEYLGMLANATVALQPFPFGGSKTSLDALSIGVPLVTMRGAFLRGRMASAHYQKMGFVDLVASNASQYVDLAVRLAQDRSFRASAIRAIQSRVGLLFNDAQVPLEWGKWMSRAIQASRRESHLEAENLALAEKAVEAFNAGLLQSARAASQELVERLGAISAEVHSDHGAILQQLGQSNIALAHFQTAVRMRPSSAQAHNNLAVTLQGLGTAHERPAEEKERLLQEAEQHFRMARQINASWSTPVYNLGNLYRDLGRADQAFELYLSALRLEDESMSPSERAETIVLALFQGLDAVEEQSLARSVSSKAARSVRRISSAQSIQVVNNAAKLLDYRQIGVDSLAHKVARGINPATISDDQSGTSNGGVALVVQPFKAKSMARRLEFARALQENIGNPHIDEIHILSEDWIALDSDLGVPIEDKANKVFQHNIGERLGFASAFRFANKLLAGKRVILANADIFFDQTITRSAFWLETKENKRVLALMRWEYDYLREEWRIQPRVDSQDAWIFVAPLDLPKLEPFNFLLGTPRCDNRLVYLFEQQGLQVLNPCFDIIAFHLHRSSARPKVADTLGEGRFLRLELPVFPRPT